MRNRKLHRATESGSRIGYADGGSACRTSLGDVARLDRDAAKRAQAGLRETFVVEPQADKRSGSQVELETQPQTIGDELTPALGQTRDEDLECPAARDPLAGEISTLVQRPLAGDAIVRKQSIV